jgi:hypothetical protein
VVQFQNAPHPSQALLYDDPSFPQYRRGPVEASDTRVHFHRLVEAVGAGSLSIGTTALGARRGVHSGRGEPPGWVLPEAVEKRAIIGVGPLMAAIRT